MILGSDQDQKETPRRNDIPEHRLSFWGFWKPKSNNQNCDDDATRDKTEQSHMPKQIKTRMEAVKKVSEVKGRTSCPQAAMDDWIETGIKIIHTGQSWDKAPSPTAYICPNAHLRSEEAPELTWLREKGAGPCRRQSNPRNQPL